MLALLIKAVKMIQVAAELAAQAAVLVQVLSKVYHEAKGAFSTEDGKPAAAETKTKASSNEEEVSEKAETKEGKSTCDSDLIDRSADMDYILNDPNNARIESMFFATPI